MKKSIENIIKSQVSDIVENESMFSAISVKFETLNITDEIMDIISDNIVDPDNDIEFDNLLENSMNIARNCFHAIIVELKNINAVMNASVSNLLAI